MEGRTWISQFFCVSIHGGTCLNIHYSAVIWLVTLCLMLEFLYYLNVCVCMYRLYNGSAHGEFNIPRQLPLHPDLSTVALRQLLPLPHNAGLKSATVAALILWLTTDTSAVVTVLQFFLIGLICRSCPPPHWCHPCTASPHCALQKGVPPISLASDQWCAHHLGSLGHSLDILDTSNFQNMQVASAPKKSPKVPKDP